MPRMIDLPDCGYFRFEGDDYSLFGDAGPVVKHFQALSAISFKEIGADFVQPRLQGNGAFLLFRPVQSIVLDEG